VKCLCAKNAQLHNWVKQTAMQHSTIRNSCLKYLSSDAVIIWCTDKKTFTAATLKPQNNWLYAPEVVTKRTCKRHQSVTDGNSQCVNNTPVPHLSIQTQSLSTTVLMWCCYDSSRPPYPTSLASSPFNWTVPQRTVCLCARCWPMFKILLQKTAGNL